VSLALGKYMFKSRLGKKNCHICRPDFVAEGYSDPPGLFTSQRFCGLFIEPHKWNIVKPRVPSLNLANDFSHSLVFFRSLIGR
jgi:hypothetical protein